MAKDTGGTGRGGRSGVSKKVASRKSAPRRRSVVTVPRRTAGQAIAETLQSPPVGWGVLVGAAFIMLCTALVNWGRGEAGVAIGQLMNETRTVRTAFTTADLDATETRRDAARAEAPRVYQANEEVLESVRTELESLPRTLAAVETLEDVAEPIRVAFRLSPEGLAAVQQFVIDGEVTPAWRARVRDLIAGLERRPILDLESWQRAMQEGNHRQIELRFADREPVLVAKNAVVNGGDDDDLTKEVRFLGERVGFQGAALRVVVARILTDRRPTFRYDAAESAAKQNAAAEAVEVIERDIPRGTVIFSRGDVLSPVQFELYKAALDRQQGDVLSTRWWTRTGGSLAAVLLITSLLVGYTAIYVPRARTNAGRMVGLALVMLGMVSIASAGALLAPKLAAALAPGAVVLGAMVLVVAYDRRIAMAYGMLASVLVLLATRGTAGELAVMIVGIAAAAWRLDSVRDRQNVVAAGLWTGGALAFATIAVAMVERPLASELGGELIRDAGLAAFAGLSAAGITLFSLPMIERSFDITTGMTLIELRDPKQPLLRQLQQRAPGTYNHSLNVAAIAETAADAIGADPLLTYVGALYHDIGKMNKPEYFVENQSRGANKHDKLSPAMSLLVIVGHVKDGVEMAKAAGLPRSLIHFIEAHHGTTLVEYFFYRAKKKAEQEKEEGGGDVVVGEMEYRYPGPRPRSKEVAMLMLSDAVESATRAMPEPTPARIEQLVREIANKRLMDGQFDQCDLTLRELRTAAESISKTVASIYHGRIAYPTDKKESEKKDADRKDGEKLAGDGTKGSDEKRA